MSKEKQSVSGTKTAARVLFAAVFVLLAAVCVFAGAGAGETPTSGVDGGIAWSISEDGTLTISAAEQSKCTDELGPGVMKNYGTVQNLAPWMESKDSLTKLIIENGVTNIGNEAFCGCSGFTGSLTIPNTVTRIDDSAFQDCHGFTGHLDIPDTVTTIGGQAFYGCSGLTSLTIPNSMTEISGTSFWSCSSLTEILVHEGNNNYSSVNGVLYNKSQTEVVCCPVGKTGTFNALQIPSTVTTIPERAFYRCSKLTGDITIPATVTTIGNQAFEGCSGFTGSVYIHSSVTTIGLGAFIECSGLTNIIVDEGNNYYSSVNGVLYNKSQTELICCPPGKTGTFDALHIPSTVTKIGKAAFYGCSGFTGSLTIPATVTTIDDGAFFECSGLTSVSIPVTVTTIGASAFYGCSSLTEVSLHANVTMINNIAFGNCSSLTEISLPPSVTTIDAHAFRGCDTLTSIFLPKNMSEVKEYAFYNCTNLSVIYTAGNPSSFRDKLPGNVVIAETNGGIVTNFPAKPTLATPEKKGNIFKGWYKNVGFTDGPVTTYEKGGHYYAKWEANPENPFPINDDEATINKDVIDPAAKEAGAEVVLEGVSNIPSGEADSVCVGETIVSPPTGDNISLVLTKIDISLYKGEDKAILTAPVTITFTVTLPSGSTAQNIRVEHYNSSANSWEIIQHSADRSGDNYSITIITMNFSPFAVVLVNDAPTKKSSSPSQGTSVWLTATPTPTPTATTTPTPTPGDVPTVKPIDNPTQQPKTPTPILGILAGLGAAALLFTARQRR